MDEGRIGTLKDMHRTTDLRQVRAVVVPPDPGWRPAAERLAGALKACAGRSLPVVSGEAEGLAGLREGHVAFLGSAMNNPALLALYRRKCHFLDDYYPGGDGYAVRTLHNPEGLGHNALLVGASRPEGAAAGLDRLEAILRDSGSRLPWTNVSRSDTHQALLPTFTPEAFRERTEQAFRGNAGRGPIEQGIGLGLVHHFTGDPDCARMFRDVLFYYEDLVKNRHGGVWCFEHMLFIYAWVWRLFYTWDLIEESDAFTDAERLRMTNLLWGLTRYVADLGYFRRDAPDPEIRQNHSTFAALSMSFSAGYFETYYGIRDFERHLRICRLIFDGQADCYKPNDDGGGGGYCWLVPNHQMTYDLKRDDHRFLEGGHLRGIADYAILITDNLGAPVDFGDVGAYAGRRRASPGVVATLCKAAWYYGDGGYLWALDWMGGKPQHDCFYRALTAHPPERMTGIALAPFNGPLYDWVVKHGPGGANVPLSEAFDKMTLRGGFGEEDEYLLLDGTSTFAHGHEDGNSIERLTWKGRMWLAETDYIWKRPRHHSSVVSICDGESGGMPSLVALKWAEDFGDAAFTRTAVPAYNGVDWTRDILWRKGRYFLVADTLSFLREADYDLRCLWRTLGDVALDGADLTVAQRGVHFRIRNADDSDKALETEEPRVTGQDPYKAYDYADGPIRIFEQRKTLRGRRGGTERYYNLLVAGTEAEVAACRVRRVGEGLVRLEGPDGPAAYGAATPEIELGGLRIAAETFLISEDRIVLLDGVRMSGGGITIESEAPMHLAIDPVRGQGEIRVRRETTATFHPAPGWTLDGSSPRASDGRAAVRLSPGTHAVTFPPMPPDVPKGALEDRPPYPYRRTPKANRFEPARKPGIEPLWEATLAGGIQRVEVRDGRIGLGSRSGQVALADGEGRIRWTRETGAEVRAVHLTDARGEAGLLAGGRDCALTLYGPDGEVRWKRAFERSHGRDQIVNDAKAADLEGDGRTEIVAATDGWLVWALTPDGEEVWQRQIEHHAARSLAIADVEGDGRREILVATEYYNSNMLEADGRIRWTIRGGPCYTALALADLDGNGVLESVYGSMDGNVYLFDSVSGALRWTSNLGDDVRHGFPVRIDGRIGLVAGSEAGQVAWLEPDGRKRWRRDVEDPVTGLALLERGEAGPGTIAAATATGWISILSAEGEIIGSHRMDAPVTAMASATFGSGPVLIVGTESGKVAAFRIRGARA